MSVAKTEPERYLRINVVAQRLDCSTNNVYNLIQNGMLKAVRIGKRALRIKETSYKQFIESREVDPEEYFAD